jgi:ferritin
MAFQPMDIQVNVMQASNVAELAANAREEPERAKSERLQNWVQERQEEENTSEETTEDDGNQAIDEDEGGNQANSSVSQANAAGVEESEEERTSRSSEPDKGTHLDLTT